MANSTIKNVQRIDVSVVMAEYNTNTQHLKDAIRSIITQSFKNFELIIVDDRGRSNLGEIVAEFGDSRIKIIKNDKNVGFAASLNNGIKHTQGRYIVRMDTDDIALPDRIKKIYDFICMNPQYDVVGTRAIEFSGSKEYGLIGKSGEKDKKSIIRGDTLVHPSVIINKSSFVNIKYDEHYRRSQDYVLWCEILIRGGKLYVMEEPLLKYRVNIDDYKKRNLKGRRFEIEARIKYFPKLNATLLDYGYIAKCIIAGVLPHGIVQSYRKKFVLIDNERNT